ncbi:MAG: TRAP transporter large permease, partial [Synergistaceae bacterium]|nr:TRAP transporter large permease [Synergistaceae bacterium]
LGGAVMIMNYFYSKRYHVPVADFSEVRKRKKEILTRSMVALIAPLIIVGGIVTGVVTPTESGALAVGYCLVAGLLYTRQLTLRIIAESLYETVRLSSSIFIIMGAATVIGWLLKWEQVPQKFASLILDAGIVDKPWVLMIVLSAIIFPVGMFMEEVSTLALLTPIFTPIAMKAGIDPFHFGIVMTLNVTIALITPPMGACNYIVAAVGKVPLADVFKNIWPFIGVSLIVLLTIITFPSLTTLVPKLLNL